MTRLNIGCGADSWGDIRVDAAFRSQTGTKNSPNLIASALNLPIRTGSISKIRCWHVIEHLTDWKSLLDEIARVSVSGGLTQLRFPLDDGFKRDFLISWAQLDFPSMHHAYLTRKNRAHLWTVSPRLVSQRLVEAGFAVTVRRNPRKFLPRWLAYGRKGKYLRRLLLYSPELPYEWEVNAVKK